MDGLTDMQREIIQRGIVTKEEAQHFNESFNLDEYGTRERPTVSPLASDKPLQRAYKWFSAAESLANSGAPNLNFDNLVRKANEHISMIETSHLGPESPRTEAERYSLGRRVSNWKKLVARWEDAEKCARRKLNLIEFVVQQGGDGDKIRDEISVTCKQRDGAPGSRYYFHSSDGQCYRSNKEVCKKFLGITKFTFGDEAAPRTPIGCSRGPTDVDVSDAGHVPEALPEAMPDAFTEAAEWFRAARKSAQAVYQLDPEELSAFSGAGIRHVDAVKALMSSWPPSVRGTIRGHLMKWEMLIMRWMTAAAEVQLVYGFDAETAKIAKMRRGFLDSLQASQQEYREKQLLKRTCSLCGKTAALSSRAFSYCSGCRDADVAAGGVRVRWHWARYCSDECQRAHWLARHADECPGDPGRAQLRARGG